ncbi:MAG: RsmE family RNA methyltransferase [Dissulfuribacterales bacterium]
MESDTLMTNQKEFLLKGQEAIHALRVLRMKPEEEIVLTDGLGHLARARITGVERNALLLQYIERLSLTDDRLPIHLLIALLKPEKMDLVIQKATELGVQKIWPVTTEYSKNEKIFIHTAQKARYARWTEIARQALKQCRGAFLPEIHGIMPLKAACEAFHKKNDHTRLFCWEAAAAMTSAPWPEITPPCILALGPEGGFSDYDCRVLYDHNFLPVSLGQRILRAETAAIAAISITAHLLSRSKTDD